MNREDLLKLAKGKNLKEFIINRKQSYKKS